MIESIGGDAEIYEKYKLKLGNLTLFEKTPNVLAGRKPFKEKIPAYEASQFYITSSLVKKIELGSNNAIVRMNTNLLTFNDWGTEEIDQRQEMLAKLMTQIWKTS